MGDYRCFAAILLPEVVREALAQAQNRLRDWPGQIKWVAEDNFHLTLKFLGDVPVGRISVIQQLLTEIARDQRAFSVTAAGLGAFPNGDRPRVIWAGIFDPTRNLHRLQQRVEDKLAGAGFPRDPKKFSAHLTLGRVKEVWGGPPPGFAAGLPRLEIAVTEIHLMRSMLSPTGPTYSMLHSFTLQET